MSHPSVADIGDFEWGRKRGVGAKNKDIQFYESFVFDGVEYFLYDCVYFYHTDHVETSVGKLVRIYEKPNHEKMVKVVWFFRPTEIRNFLGNYRPSWNELFLASGVGKDHVETSVGKLVRIYEKPNHEKMFKVVWFFRPTEIRNFLGNYRPSWNELFLASGVGKGVSNVNYLESIIGKCSVVCTSKDKRNPKPSEAELKRADFFFNCTFDVGRHVIIDKFADEIAGVKVEQFFNRRGDKKTSDHLHVGTNIRPKTEIETGTDPSDILRCQVKDKAEARTPVNVLPKRSLHSFPDKKRKIVEEKSIISQSNNSPKEEEFNEKKAEPRQDKKVQAHRKVIEVTERPDAEKRRWFWKMPWEEILREAQELDTLVLLNNLDPSYTSYEVEDLVWHALKEKVKARMIEWSPTSNPYYGRALVIFKTKDAAESAISQLNKRCLILGEGRVVSATKGTLREPGKQRKFTCHWDVDRFVFHKQRLQKRKAVSTSHCSQPNTIEYDMAVEWLLQDQKSNAWCNALYQRQMKEIQDVKSKLKMDRIFC